MVAAQYFPIRLEVDTQEGETVYSMRVPRFRRVNQRALYTWYDDHFNIHALTPTTSSPSRRRTLYHENHGPLPWKDLNVPFHACKCRRSETAPTIKVPWTSWTPNLPQYVLSRQSFGLNLNLIASHFCSFRIPR
jgi:hypothetical protein